jgi:2-polyprenyl-6-methoxyphenol hydroxylase-like FAD-dependent oxidoreductase
MTSRTDDVVIVGAGPVGLCLALLLAERGVSVRVLEAESDINRELRASTFHPPTLDLLEPLGVTQEMIDQGLVCPHWQIRLHPSGERAVFDLSVLADDTRHPYRLQCEQWKLSKALLDRLRRSPHARLEFDAKVETVAAADDGVTVELATKAGRERLRAAYVVGCDGARSVVRESVGLAFEGVTYPETTLLATTLFPFEQHLEGLSNVSYCWKDGGNFSLLKVPGRWRVSIYPDEHLSIDAQMTDAALDASLQVIVPRAEPYEVREKRPYRVHMRIAASYRRGRVLLAGDAAHLNAPPGGMGLNGGIHDAFELAAALADVIKHGAADDRLDRYDRRRRPVARDDIMGQADRNRARMRERAPEKRRELLRELQAITNDRARLYGYLLRSSMIEGLRRAAAIE